VSGRIIPGAGRALNAELVSAINADNSDPALAANQVQELTVTGTPQSITTEEYTGVVGGAPGAGDVVDTVLDGVTYGYMVQTGDTVATVAGSVTNACMQGAIDVQIISFVGNSAGGGDAEEVSIAANDYQHVTVPGETAASLVTAFVALMVADPLYDAFAAGDDLILIAKLPGVGALIVATTDGVQFTHTATNPVVGTVANSTWTVTDDSIDTVTLTLDIAGDPGAATCSGSVTLGTGTTTWNPVQTTAGYPADLAIVSSGATSFQHTVQPGDDDDAVAAGLALVLNGSFGFVASATLNVITVTRTDYAAFSFSDNSVQVNPASTMVITPATTVPLVVPTPITDGADLGGVRASQGSLYCELSAGTSYDVSLWYLIGGVWVLDLTFSPTPVTISGTGVLTFTPTGTRIYVACSSFVGGAVATVTALTNQ